MKTPIRTKNLRQEAPHSPRELLYGFAIAARTVDKCRASLAGTLGDFHYDCPLDNMLFAFKGINGDQFKEAVKKAAYYEDVGTWLQANGTPKTSVEIRNWSEQMIATNPFTNPERRAWFSEECGKLGLDPATTTLFDWLEADDRALSAPKKELAHT